MIRRMLVMAVGAWIALVTPALAYEAADSDAFFLGAGSSNVEVQGSTDLLSGSNVFGGVRLGLFWTVFVELGYSSVAYFDRASVGGVAQNISFRTTGANAGLGLILPIRNVRLGAKYLRNPRNRWVEEITDPVTGTVAARISGDIDFDTYNVFVLFGETGAFEVGVRRDLIRETTASVSNSFGPYLAWNISLK